MIMILLWLEAHSTIAAIHDFILIKPDSAQSTEQSKNESFLHRWNIAWNFLKCFLFLFLKYYTNILVYSNILVYLLYVIQTSFSFDVKPVFQARTKGFSIIFSHSILYLDRIWCMETFRIRSIQAMLYPLKQGQVCHKSIW